MVTVACLSFSRGEKHPLVVLFLVIHQWQCLGASLSCKQKGCRGIDVLSGQDGQGRSVVARVTQEPRQDTQAFAGTRTRRNADAEGWKMSH